MPFDTLAVESRENLSLREAVLELMARKAADPTMSDIDYRCELKNLIVDTRQPARELWNQYHNPSRASLRARTYMKYGY